MVPLVLVVLVAGRVATILSVGALAMFAFREFARATGLDKDSWMTAAVYVGIAAVAATSLVQDPWRHLPGWYGLFMALPVYVVSLILIVPIARNRTKGQLQKSALAVLGFIYMGWMFSHVGFLANSPHAYGYLMFLLLAVESGDVVFTREGAKEEWTIRPDLFARVTSWSRVNIVNAAERDPRASSDIIFCRNLFIYFTPVARAGRRDAAWRATMPSPGYLCVGAAESLLRPAPALTCKNLEGRTCTSSHDRRYPGRRESPASIVRVLVVDDSAYVRKMMTQMLTRSPFVDVVGTARDGKEALELAASAEARCHHLRPEHARDGRRRVRARADGAPADADRHHQRRQSVRRAGAGRARGRRRGFPAEADGAGDRSPARSRRRAGREGQGGGGRADVARRAASAGSARAAGACRGTITAPNAPTSW